MPNIKSLTIAKNPWYSIIIYIVENSEHFFLFFQELQGTSIWMEWSDSGRCSVWWLL